MTDLRHRIRRAIESALPWFDRAEEDRARHAFERERRASMAARAHAEETMLREAYRDYGRRVNDG